jgi:hypothetical protein
MTESLLEDPSYTPKYQPVRGKPPEVVKKWRPRSQVRWFARMWRDDKLNVFTRELTDYYCHSVEHTGPCCISCEMDEHENGWPNFDDHCCCYGYTAAKESS